jgi:PIN domain nuclease of toxin-antitoxin system
MRLLLDTQVMLWWLLDDRRLGPETRQLLADHPALVSVTSIWEVAIKHRLGKLAVAADVFRDQSLAAGAALLPLPACEHGHCMTPQADRPPYRSVVISPESMASTYTALISRDGAWWVGWVEEVPGVNAQERSREKLLDSLRVVLREALELNREEALQVAGASYEELAFTL